MKRRWTKALAVTSALLLFASVAASAEDSLEDRLADTRDQLDQARSQQSSLRGQVTDAEAELERADARLITLETQLAERKADLALATADWEQARARTEEVGLRLAELTTALDDARSDLAAKQNLFDARAAAAYKYGTGLSYASAVLRAESISEVATTTRYIQSVMQWEQGLIDDVSARAYEIAATRRDVDATYDELSVQETVARRAQAEMERAANVHRRLLDMVTQERSARAALLIDLESDLNSYNQLVSSLEAESQALARELAARDWWKAGRPGKGELLWPTDGRAGSGFGWRTHPIFGTRRMHTGVDIGAPYGQPVISAADGRVVSAGWRGGYGIAVVIDHGGGLATLYAHLSRAVVSEGEIVAQGQKIAEVGSTGQSTGPHLHFEVRVNGTPEDPMKWY